MTLADALRASFRTYVARPGDVLPFFVAGLAAPMAGQTVLVVGLLAIGFYFASTGRYAEFLDRVDGALPEDERIGLEQAQAADVPAEELGPAFEVLSTPTAGAILLATLAGVVLSGLVAGAIVGAGQTHAVYAVLRDRSVLPDRSVLRAGVDGVFRHWLTFAVLALVELVVIAGFSVPLLLFVVGAVVANPVFGVFVALVAVLVWFAVVAPIRLLFSLARPAAVVDDAGFAGALGGSVGFVRSNPLQAIGYGVVALVAYFAASVVAGVLVVVQATAPAALLTALVVTPLLVLLKTSLYADSVGSRLSVPESPTEPLRQRASRAFREGFRELLSFVRAHPLLHVASVGIGVAGVALGLRTGATMDHLFYASIEYRLAQGNPLGMLVNYGANNWRVTAAIGFSGFGFGVPAIAGMLFNGINVGFLFALERDPRVLALFLVPHGLVELPAIFVSGALGLRLGIVSLRYAAGRADRTVLVEEFGRAYRVVVGLAVLVAVAAVLEAFVSPYYWRVLGL